MFGGWDIAIIIFVVLALVIGGLYFFNRWAGSRMAEHNTLVERSKQATSIYVIDKKKDRLQNVNLPKAIQEQIPKWNKIMKMHLVKAKIGPQIMTLICDKEVFNSIPIKKTINVELAGIYIVGLKGAKGKKDAPRKEEALPWYKRIIRR